MKWATAITFLIENPFHPMIQFANGTNDTASIVVDKLLVAMVALRQPATPPGVAALVTETRTVALVVGKWKQGDILEL